MKHASMRPRRNAAEYRHRRRQRRKRRKRQTASMRPWRNAAEYFLIIMKIVLELLKLQ